MPAKIEMLYMSVMQIGSLVGLIFSTTMASAVSIATASPLSSEDIADLKTGDAQTVLAVMLVLLVLALLASWAVVAKLFKSNETRHTEAHAERDKREDKFHDISERMIIAVTESTAQRQKTNEILIKMESTVHKCQEDSILMKKGDLVRVSK